MTTTLGFGLYGVVIKQGTKINHSDWNIVTFNDYLANIGGYASFLWSLVAILFGTY